MVPETRLADRDVDPTEVSRAAWAVVFGNDTPAEVRSVSWELDAEIALAAIPEPSSFAIMGLGLIGMAGYGWRRRRKAA